MSVIPAVPNAGPETETAGRGEKGRFAKGNRGGPGNPFNRRIAAFRKAIVDAVTEQDIYDVTHALIRKAKDGDIAAIKLFYQYTIGKPEAAVNPDRCNDDEWDLLTASQVKGDDGQSVLVDGMPIDMAIPLAEVMRETKITQMRNQMAQNEAAMAEEAAFVAAEQAEIDRGVEAAKQAYREEQARKAAEGASGRPTANGYNGATGGGNGPSNGFNGGAGRPSNGDNGRGGEISGARDGQTGESRRPELRSQRVPA